VTSWQKLRDEAAGGGGSLARLLAGLVVGTIHPSAVLRGPDPEDSEDRDRAYAGLVADLAAAREAAAEAAR
jgi:hypothetical protein